MEMNGKDYIVRRPPQGETRDPLPSRTQYIGNVYVAVCRECGKRVKWKVRNTYKAADGMHLVQYLRCPTKGCCGKASRIVDLPG